MNGRADVVCRSSRVDGSTWHSPGVGPASTKGRTVPTTTAWPNTSSLKLGALPTAPSCARLHTNAVLHEWGMAHLVETAELVVSELVTNAMQSSLQAAMPRTAPVGLPVVYLRLLADHHGLVIEVFDHVTALPVLTQAALDEGNGRGLMLVDALCERWGCEPVPGWGGKVVWAEVRVDGP
jgi:hypothetical protein